jgi:hypothetical protein
MVYLYIKIYSKFLDSSKIQPDIYFKTEAFSDTVNIYLSVGYVLASDTKIYENIHYLDSIN